MEQVAISYSKDLRNPGIKPESLAQAGRFFTSEPPEKPKVVVDKLVLQDRNSEYFRLGR